MSDSAESRGTVVVIEDDLDISEYMTAVLNDHGYRTEVVMDGDLAVEKVKEVQPDGVTLDLLLPGRTGINIYRNLRKNVETKDIPVVIITGVGTEGKKLAVKKFFTGRSIPDPDGVLQKPVTPEALLSAVDHAIESRRADDKERTDS